MPRAPRPASPLPQRHGVGATRLRVTPGPWRTVADFLLARFPDDAVRLRAVLAAGGVVDGDGRVLTATTPARVGSTVHLHRDPPDEVPVPFAVDVLHRDDDLLVVDKPHFLATTPRGAHVRQTVLARLRHELDLPELSPAHRLDRLTAGVLVLTVHRAARRPYQELFAARGVEKVYEAVAPVDPALALPRTVRSRVVKTPGVLAAREVPGEPNAETEVELLGSAAGLGRYRLRPRTGRTHQLRVHLASLGLPICGDPLLPVVLPDAPGDFSTPLQLLARSVAFDDPVTGEPRRFTSRRALSRWAEAGG
ncbi:RluA family pseudouridine synthase [Rhodococcus aerolatus]